jgi:hypothetical protein
VKFFIGQREIYAWEKTKKKRSEKNIKQNETEQLNKMQNIQPYIFVI